MLHVLIVFELSEFDQQPPIVATGETDYESSISDSSSTSPRVVYANETEVTRWIAPANESNSLLKLCFDELHGGNSPGTISSLDEESSSIIQQVKLQQPLTARLLRQQQSEWFRRRAENKKKSKVSSHQKRRRDDLTTTTAATATAAPWSSTKSNSSSSRGEVVVGGEGVEGTSTRDDKTILHIMSSSDDEEYENRTKGTKGTESSLHFTGIKHHKPDELEPIGARLVEVLSYASTILRAVNTCNSGTSSCPMWVCVTNCLAGWLVISVIFN